MNHHMVNGSVPGGKPGGPLKLTNMNGSTNMSKPIGKTSTQYQARTNFLLEHLASFTLKTSQESQVSAKERLSQTKELLAKGNLWTKEMEMRLTDNDVVLLDGETQDVIEVYPLSSMGTVQHISDDSDLNSVLLFSTIQTDDKYAATHLFQSDRVPAAVVATEIMKAASSKEAMPNRSPYAGKRGASLPPPPSYSAPQPPVDRERMDLHERSLVAQTIAAFSAVSAEPTNVRRPTKVTRGVSQGDGESLEESLSVDVLEARTNRDVQILNHCIDDIEILVWRTKKSAEAWKKLQKKKGKIKSDNPLALEARPPPEGDFIDAFQKFKHAFNLLGKLRQHIHNPNASELVHYLFVPLSLLVRCTSGPDKAKGVLSPLLTSQAIELLQNCLSSKETELWTALGLNWTETKQNKRFKDQFIPPYAPVFKDGWVPPEYIGSKDVPAHISAAVAANAAAVAQMNELKREDSGATSPTVLAAAAKFRRLANIERETPASSPSKKSIFRRSRVLYEFEARNSRELSVKESEELVILDDTRQWWCVRNAEGAIGFIPNTIIENKESEAKLKDSVYLPSPPSTAPPPVPNASITNVQVKRIETTSSTTGSRKIPHVELRHVPANERPASTSDENMPIPPPPPASPPPPTPPSTAKKSPKRENGEDWVDDFQKAILSGGNLKKVDREAVQRKKDEAQVKRMSSADLLNDELKRRMTHGQGGLTPRLSHKVIKESTVTLTPESGPDEVRAWLKSKNFSQTCITALQWKSVKDLDKMSKEDLKRFCGDAEGARIYSQFSVQKATWKTTTKGAELQFIMQRRKEMVDVQQKPEEPAEHGNLRNLVAEARAVADAEEQELQDSISVKRHSYSGSKPIMVAAPQERARTNSMLTEREVVAQPERPPTGSKPITPPPASRKSSGLSFGNEEFVPPPPVLDDYDDKSAYENEVVLTPDQVENILKEQKKQQELLMEHEKQFALLERLQRQKLELEEHKREFEEQRQRQKQADLEDKKYELKKQIKAQQDELKANQDRIEQQKLLMVNYNTMMQPRLPAMNPQVPVIPVSGVQPQHAYLPMGGVPTLAGMQPLMGYTPAMTQSSVPQMIPTFPMGHPMNPMLPQ